MKAQLSTSRPLCLHRPSGAEAEEADFQQQLKQMLEEEEEKEAEPLPPMTQPQFIQLCKTLCVMIHGDAQEAALLQAVATVTSLVLQIGEAGHRGPAPEVAGPRGPRGSEVAEDEWTVGFAQILASLLTEPALVNFLEKPLDLGAVVTAAREKQYHQRAGLLTLQTR
ncbi:TBC1 domain family member 8 [Liparis tanakae]|uniref:TBC1 domain family member 8 n=1 Tax=Liparis tanakae TaxID=230148 RepID=A0A4Z2E4J8_9TELE|nr:TBC1 domain family member 8 [Liparis tanakae]